MISSSFLFILVFTEYADLILNNKHSTFPGIDPIVHTNAENVKHRNGDVHSRCARGLYVRSMTNGFDT